MIVSFYNAVFRIACYYAAASFAFCYPAALDHGTDPYAFGLLMAAALLLALGETGAGCAKVLRMAALLLPAPALVWNHALPGILEYALPWGYLVYLTYRRQRTISYYYFLTDFQHVLWLFPIMFSFLMFRPQRGFVALREAVPYAVVFLTAGVSLLQTLRHQQGKGAKGLVKHQGIQAARFFLLCILLTVGGVLDFLENVLFRRILLPAGLFFVNQIWALIQYVSRQINVKPPGNGEKDFVDYIDFVEKNMAAQEPLLEPSWSIPPEPIPHREINYVLIVVLVALVAAVLIFAVLRTSMKKRVQKNVILDEREKLPEGAKHAKKSRHRDTPQENIRKSYRKFMQLADGMSHKLKVQDTTEEIREKYVRGKEDGKAAAFAGELTGIYRMARYRGALKNPEAGSGGLAADPSAGRKGDVLHAGYDGEKDSARAAAHAGNLRQEAKRMKILLDYLRKV